ncbi:MAG: protealysin inhibitor emfourin [Sodalis sp. (in: enterobacteria)]|uniref:protealysin inhibitor emfourin n=1 Tax=Sodalis sp. (in: enterobacteria) TaxID=1898979 RepID=UPI003F30A555
MRWRASSASCWGFSAPKRERLCALINRAAPLAQPPRGDNTPGRGDQRYFRIQIFYRGDGATGTGELDLLVPEQSAPPELQALWRHGQLEDEPPAPHDPS